MFTIWTVGNNEYKLKLTTAWIIQVEKRIGCSIMGIYGSTGEVQIPEIGKLVTIIWGALQKYHHDISLIDTYDLFDEWMEEGHGFEEVSFLIMEIFKASGLMKEQKGEPKNAEAEA